MADRGAGQNVIPLTPYSVSVSYRGGNSGQGSSWFGPLSPQPAAAPPEVAGRQFDYPAGANIALQPKVYEGTTFADLRALADGWDLLRLVIETRKDQVERMAWSIKPRDAKKAKAGDGRIAPIDTFFRRPNGQGWPTWLRRVLEDLFVIDAPSAYCQRNRGGKLLGLLPIDGATIKPVVDDWGRTPSPIVQGGTTTYPVAYQQVLKGLPAVDYTTRDLIYRPRNVRNHRVYGFSPVEQIITTVNIALRRQLSTLSYYTEGNVPDSIIGVPETWSPDQVMAFQGYWDATFAGNVGARRHAKFVPGGVGKFYKETREPELKGEYDDWLSKVVCFAFSISPQALTKQMNRASADTQKEMAEEEGLAPILAWIKELVDDLIATEFGAPDLEFDWVEDTQADPAVEEGILTSYATKGVITINEARDRLGLDKSPNTAADTLMVLTGTGYVPIEVNTIEGKQANLDAFGPPPAAPGFGGAVDEDGDGKAAEPAADEPPPAEKVAKFDDGQARDEHGRWTSGGGSGGSTSPDEHGRAVAERAEAKGSSSERLADENIKRVVKGVTLVAAGSLAVALAPGSAVVAVGAAAVEGIGEHMFTEAGISSAEHILNGLGFETARVRTLLKPLTDFFKDAATALAVTDAAALRVLRTRLPDVATAAFHEVTARLRTEYPDAPAGNMTAVVETLKDCCARYKAACEGLGAAEKVAKYRPDQTRDDGGRFTLEGSTDPASDGHKAWAGRFSGWLDRSMSGGQRASTATVTGHMKEHNAEVIAATARHAQAKRKVNAARYAETFTPVDPEDADNLAAAERHLREVKAAARQALGTRRTAYAKALDGTGAGNLEKGQTPSSPVKPIPVIRKATRTAMASIARRLTVSLAATGRAAATALRAEKMAKAVDPDDINALISGLDFSDLEDDASALSDDLAGVASDTVPRALAQIGVDRASDLVDQVNDRAVAQARARAAELVGMRVNDDGSLSPNPNTAMAITDTTREMLRDAIASGLKDNIGTPAIADTIEGLFAFSSARAQMIAETEVADANSLSALDSYRAAGDVGITVRKAWITAPEGCCDVCAANAAQGAIDLDEDFESGDAAPTAHPKCKCAIVPVVPDAAEKHVGRDRLRKAGNDGEARDDRGRWTSGDTASLQSAMATLLGAVKPSASPSTAAAAADINVGWSKGSGGSGSLYDHEFTDHALEHSGDIVAHVHGTVQVEYDDADNWTAHHIVLGSGDTAVNADEVLTPEAVESLQESLGEHISDEISDLTEEDEDDGVVKAFDPNKHPRDEGGQFAGAGASGRATKRLAQRAIGDGSHQDVLDLGRVDGSRYSAAAGRDVEGWRYGLTADFVRHVENRHGPDSDDRNPITAGDYENLPTLLRKGTITSGGRTASQNLQTAVVTGTVRGQGYRAVLAVRKRTRSLTLHSFQRKG